MQTRIVIVNGAATFDVLDGEGTECQEKNKKYYDRLRKVMGLPETAISEKPKMSMLAAEDMDQEKETLTDG